jgi:hypothetical protein
MSSPVLSSQLPRPIAQAMFGSRPPYYVHRTNPWVWRGLLSVALAFALGTAGFAAAQVVRGRVGGAEILLGLFSLVFLVLLCRPASWRVPVAMVGDRQGLHFLHGGNSMQVHSVAWGDIGGLAVERHATGNGVTRTVVVRIRADSPFWAPAVNAAFMAGLLQAADADGYRRLPLPPIWSDPDHALAALAYLRSRSTVA